MRMKDLLPEQRDEHDGNLWQNLERRQKLSMIHKALAQIRHKK